MKVLSLRRLNGKSKIFDANLKEDSDIV